MSYQRSPEKYQGPTPYHGTPAAYQARSSAHRDPPPSEDSAAVSPRTFPVVRQRSPIAAIPWRLPVAPSPSGLAADQGRVGGLDVRAASLVGPAHRCGAPALPRQDAYRLGQDARHDYLIVAVADGMSDSKHSDAGANVAASAVVGEIRTRLDEGMSLDQLDPSDIFAAAAGQMIGAADQRGWNHDDVRCALAAAVIPAAVEGDSGRRAWLAALADVNVWLWQPGEWLPPSETSRTDWTPAAELLPAVSPREHSKQVRASRIGCCFGDHDRRHRRRHLDAARRSCVVCRPMAHATRHLVIRRGYRVRGYPVQR